MMLKKTLLLICWVALAACQIWTPMIPIKDLFEEIRKASDNNPGKLHGKRIKIRGYTYGVDGDPDKFGGTVGSISVGEKGGAGIPCRFTEKDAPEFSKIKGLQFITVEGVVDMRNVLIMPCTLLNVEPETVYPVKLVERSAVYYPRERPEPLELIVKIEKEGKTWLNKEPVGDYKDPKPLYDELKRIFNDRDKNGTEGGKEIIIDPQINIPKTGRNHLIERLVDYVGAESILLIKDDLK